MSARARRLTPNTSTMAVVRHQTILATLFTLLVTTGIDAVVPAEGSPNLTTQWKVVYNATGKVNETCGRYYASVFLQNFMYVRGQLEKKCAPEISIEISRIARVRLFASQVKLSTFLKFRGPSQAKVYECVIALNETFQNVTALAQVGVINAKETCMDAVIASDDLQWDQDGCKWGCDTDWVLLDQSARCNVNRSSTETLGVCLSCTIFTSCFAQIRNANGQITCNGIENVTRCLKTVKMGNTTHFSRCWRQAIEMTLKTLSMDCNMMIPDDLVPDDFRTVSRTSPTTTTSSTVTQTTEATTSTTDGSSSEEHTDTSMETTTTPDTPIQVPVLDWSVQFMDIDGVAVPPGQTPEMILVEGGETKLVRVRTQANVSSLCGTAASCQLYLEVSFTDVATPRCRSSSASIAQVVVGRPTIESSSVNGTANTSSFCQLPLADTGALIERDESNITFPLRARIDGKYDGEQTRKMILSLKREIMNGSEISIFQDSRLAELKIRVKDEDRKGTCQSINDPHITTFDGLQYNNFYHGEFVLYKHTTLPYQVNILYQACEVTVQASCNCGVAVKSGNDIIIIDRCRYKRRVFRGLRDHFESFTGTIMRVDIYVEGEFTKGTRIHSVGEGKKYLIYLPTGTYIKVMVSDELVNVWVVASPNDFNRTKGLCGTYDLDPLNDTELRNGSVVDLEEVRNDKRGQPRTFSLDWSVDIYGPDSLFTRNKALSGEPDVEIEQYCVCEEQDSCAYALDVETCDIYEGEDVTDELLSLAINITALSAKNPSSGQMMTSRRRRRQTSNVINAMPPNEDPIRVDTDFSPPRYTWGSDTERREALAFCSNYIRESEVGRLCANIPNVNMDQEIMSCIEDIKITGNKSWADSTEDAMKEQCLEELKRNNNIPDSVADQISGKICINKCSYRGNCVNGQCVCEDGYTSVDCSVSRNKPPDTEQVRDYGLCDIELYDCSRALVYGSNFINSADLVCLLTEAIVLLRNYTIGETIKQLATFINFNSVECPIPEIRPYVIAVSNDNGLTKSQPLLFIPFNSTCRQCSTNETSCTEMEGFCFIENDCYTEDQHSPDDQCLVCEPQSKNRFWTEVTDCDAGGHHLSDAIVGIISAIVGSLIGIALGILLYILCCRRSNKKGSSGSSTNMGGPPGFKQTMRPLSDDMLHRDRDARPTHIPRVLESSAGGGGYGGRLGSSGGAGSGGIGVGRPGGYRAPFGQDYGQGVENGVDDTTYF